MATITTTTHTQPLLYPGQSLIDRRVATGDLYFLKRISTTQFGLWWSTNEGTSWNDLSVDVTRANMQETSGLWMDAEGYAHVLYRTYESGEDRIYHRRRVPGGTWESEKLVASATAGSAGAVYTGMDLVVFKLSTTWYVHMAVGTQTASTSGITMFSATINSSGTWTLKNTLIDGYRQWMVSGAGRVTPALDFKHTGDGKDGGSGPALWVVWGRGTTYAAKLSWTSGPNWYGPWTPTTIATGLTNQDSNSGRYDGRLDRFNIAIPNGSTVSIVERNVSDTGGNTRTSPTHPQGAIRSCTLSNNSSNSNYRVFGMGTSTNDLYYVDYNRAAGTWGSWTLVTATDIMGTAAGNYGVRRNSYGNGQYDLTIAHSGAPNTIVHTSSTSASAPYTPEITTPTNGTTADVASGLTIAWTFEDDDPLDSQASYALRRQIGAGAFSYWNAGTSTWGAGEVFNLSGTSSVTLPSSWGADSDATHSYSVRVRDQAALTSDYSAVVTVTPSAKDNPTISSPAHGGTVTTSQVTVTWTVTTQTAYRLQMTSGGVSLYDSGWVSSAITSFTIPVNLTDGTAYSVTLTTRNDEGLTSTSDTNDFTADFVPPDAASVTLTADAANGVITVDVRNQNPTTGAPVPVANNVYRRKVGDTDDGVLIATLDVSEYNLLTQSQYDSEAALGWANGGNATVARTNAQAHSGSWSVSATSLAAGSMNILDNPSYGTLSPPEIGATYFFKAWSRAETTPRTINLRLYFRNSVPAIILSPIVASGSNNTAGWTQFSGSYTLTDPAAITMTALIQISTPAGAGEVHYFDDFVVTRDSADGRPAAYNDFTVASGVEYEYRVETIGANGTSVYSAWTD